MLHQDEGLARGLADREHAVIVHDHGAVAGEVGDEPLALAEILGNALVRVVSDGVEETHRLLRDHAQPAPEAGDRHPGPGMDMYGAIDVRAPAQHAAMQREAGTIDACTLIEVFVHVDLHQVRRRDLGPKQLMALH
jgi:hypothetical protein